MPRQSPTLPESSNGARVSPYPARSTRTTKHEAPEPTKSELEAVRCVICMEPPHNAVLMTCTSCVDGCRPYMCNTDDRHSNCFKLFKERNKTKEILGCPLCRGEVIWTDKATTTARRFMNAKPRSCTVDDCKFSGTYAQLGKHLKNEHLGLIPPKVDPERQMRWEQLVRDAEHDELMSAIGNQHNPEVGGYQLPSIYHPPVFEENIANGTMRIRNGPLRNETTEEGRWRFISHLLSFVE